MTASVFSDPVSRVFDAYTGAPVDGARITLVHAGSGQPASPLDDDGISAFPATIDSGANGIPGAYRYPVVPSGRYRLIIQPPPGYAAPSRQTEGDLQALEGAPWFITGASYAGAFDIDTPVLRADIPIDPAAGTLFIDKQTTAASASVGDFIEFHVTLTHTGGLDAARDIEIIDDLPIGLRYAPGSARLMPEGVVTEPSFSDDGRRMVVRIDELPPDESVTLRYVTAVVPGSRDRELENAAFARTQTDISNTSTATVRLMDELFTDTAFLAGRVFLDSCDAAVAGPTQGLPGARIYLEDGRFAVTDENGRYHFEGLRPGMHTAQIDTESIPEFVDLLPCDIDQRYAGSAVSRFVDLSPGALGRVDFFARIRPPPRGNVDISLRQTVTGDSFEYTADLSAAATLELDKAELMVMLPDGIHYIARQRATCRWRGARSRRLCAGIDDSRSKGSTRAARRCASPRSPSLSSTANWIPKLYCASSHSASADRHRLSRPRRRSVRQRSLVATMCCSSGSTRCQPSCENRISRPSIASPPSGAA